MQQRNCDVCSKVYEAKRASSRYCSDLCRKRAQRAPQVSAVVPVVSLPVSVTVGGIVEATLRELESADMVGSSLGQAALILAYRLDGGSFDTGSSVAALVREHRVAVAAAVDSGRVAADPLDELAKRRSERRARA